MSAAFNVGYLQLTIEARILSVSNVYEYHLLLKTKVTIVNV